MDVGIDMALEPLLNSNPHIVSQHSMIHIHSLSYCHHDVRGASGTFPTDVKTRQSKLASRSKKHGSISGFKL